MYFENRDWVGDPILVRRERGLNLWRMSSEFPGILENYSIQWVGAIFIPASGTYRFSTMSDDGSELWVDGELIVDNRGLHGLQERSGRVQLERGFHPIVMRYMQGGGTAVFRAYWTPPGGRRQSLSNADCYVQNPSAKRWLADRVREVVLSISLALCLFVGLFVLLLWFNSHRILRPFLRDSFWGRILGRLWARIVRRHAVPQVYPTSPQGGWRVHLFALLGYTALSLVWTYPLLVEFSDKLVGLGGDRYIYLWNMWWMKKALLELHTSPLFTEYIFYPHGTGLGFHDLSILNALLSVPLQWLFSIDEIYNIEFLLTFILGGFGCFLLVRYLTGDNLAAFFSGLVFAFWGARAYNVDHLSLASVQWFPFSILYLFKTLRESSYRYPVLAAIFLVFNALSSHYYALYMVMFAGLFLFYCMVFERRQFFRVSTLTRFLLAGVLAILLMLPVAIPMLSEVAGGEDYMNYTLLIQESASPNLLLFPSANHPVLGKYVRYLYAWLGEPVQWGLTGASFLGYTLIFLCGYAIFKLRHIKQAFWILTGCVFLLLSCGPYLRIFSTFYTEVPLPYQILQHLPLLKGLRVPIRFMVLAMLAGSVLAGYASWDLLRRVRIRKTLFVLLSALLLFEYARVYYVTPLGDPTPEFYQELGQETETYAILELTPLMTWEHSSLRSSLFQISHNKKLFHGHSSRLSLDAHYQAYAVYTTFDDFVTQPRRFIEDEAWLDKTRKKILAMLSYYDVRYVALYNDYKHGDPSENRSRLKDLFGKPVAQHPGITWFRVDTVPVTESFTFPGFGLLPLEYDDGVAVRQTATQADYKVVNINEHTHLSLQFEGKAYEFPEEEVDIFINGDMITSVTVKDWTTVDIPDIPLVKGENTIRFITRNDDWKYGILVRHLEMTLR